MIDILLAAVLIWYGFAGYRRGIIVGGLSLLGFGVGAFVGIRLAPMFVEYFDTPLARTLVTIGVVVGGALIGQAAASVLARRLRRTVHRTGAGPLDHAIGAVAAVVVCGLVLWFLAGALRQTGFPVVGRTIASSRVLNTIDAIVPTPVADSAAQFRRSVADSNFPRVFEGISRENIAKVAPPDATSTDDAVLNRISRSTVKVLGDAPECGRGQEGSGVVVAPNRVVTNAHVVAGTDSLQVWPQGAAEGLDASVVLFDPATDVAVLAVPGLEAPSVTMATQALSRGADAILTGFPENGPYVVTPARVRSVVQATGEDIYGRAGVVRQVYSMYASVRQGNSGGPMLNTSGALVGLVFATSLEDPNTGYALTLKEIRDEIAAGVSARRVVSAGRCVGD